MSTTKTLVLAALTALTLGTGAAMAQESGGGVGSEPYVMQQLSKALATFHATEAQAASTANRTPQYGSSDRPAYPVPTLEGSDGNGG